MSVKKNEYTRWKNISKISLENPRKLDKHITKSIYNQVDIKLGQFTHKEHDVVLTKIKNRKAAGLDEIPPELWKTSKFDDLLLRYCTTAYNQNPIERWTKACILPFSKRGDLGIALNYRSITLTSITVKIYNALLLNHIEPEIEKFLRKNQNGFRRNRSTTLQILTIGRILGVRAKKPWSDTLICRFLQGIWLHTQREDGANTSSRWSPSHKKLSEPQTMMLSKNKRKSLLTGWRHKLLWHCCWCCTGGYLSPISVHNLPRQRTSNVDWSSEKMSLYYKSQEADDVPQKIRTQTTQMT